MELKAEIKNYTKAQKNKFIIENNHRKGFVIKYEGNSIQAWGYDDTEKFENAKNAKLQELEQKSSAFEQTENKLMYVVSSLGFKVNADPKALRNIDVLISQKVTQFKVYDNTLKPVTVEELKIIKSEIEQNALNLYHQKWDFEDMVNNAGSIEELNQIDIDFKMLDFSAVAEVADEIDEVDVSEASEASDEVLS